MADNTTLSSMTGGDVVRDLDRAGVKTQIVALDVAKASQSEKLGLGGGSVIQVASAGLTTATTAYSAGDQLGTELVFANAARLAADTSRIDSAILMDKAKVVAAVDLYLFDRSVTPAADNAAMSWSDADMAFCLGVIEFRAAKTNANNAVLIGLGLPIVLKPNATSIYGHLVTQSGHSFFGAVGDLVTTLGLALD